VALDIGALPFGGAIAALDIAGALGIYIIAFGIRTVAVNIRTRCQSADFFGAIRPELLVKDAPS
jgi:hypothetical protein